MLLSLILSLGCIQKDPKQLFLDLQSKEANLKNAKMDYTLNMNIAYLNLTGDFKIIKFNDIEKIVTTFSIYGQQSVSVTFKKGDLTITCTETFGEIKCSSEPTSTFDFTNVFGDVNITDLIDITYIDRKTIAGRSSHGFNIELTPEAMDVLLSNLSTGMGSYGENITINYIIYLDAIYGFFTYLNIEIYSFSKLTGEDIKVTGIEFTLDSFSQDATEEDVEIPVKFVIDDVLCSSNSVSVQMTSLKDYQNVQMDVELSSYTESGTSGSITIDKIDFGEKKLFAVPISYLETGSYDVEVCIDGNCQEDSCYFYSPYPTYDYCYSHSSCWDTEYSTGCCLGQCNLTTYDCYSSPQSEDYTSYGQEFYCEEGQTCGTDCQCY